MLKQDLQESRAVVVPTGLLLHQVDEAVFEEYRGQLASVTPSNWGAVREKITELGIDGRGRILARDTQEPLPASFPRTRGANKREAGVGATAEVLGHVDVVTQLLELSTTSEEPVAEVIASAQECSDMPLWADKGSINCLNLYPISEKQYICTVQFDKAMVRAMVDTGAHGCMVDAKTAAQMQLNVTEAKGGNYGAYSSPGYPPRPYAGIVHGPVPLRFSNEVVIMVPFVRVIESDKPQVILGVDLLCTGRERWNFAGLELKANVAYLMFELGSRRVKVPLDNCPSLTPRMGTTAALPAA